MLVDSDLKCSERTSILSSRHAQSIAPRTRAGGASFGSLSPAALIAGEKSRLMTVG
jgi:hypothetical protein